VRNLVIALSLLLSSRAFASEAYLSCNLESARLDFVNDKSHLPYSYKFFLFEGDAHAIEVFGSDSGMRKKETPFMTLILKNEFQVLSLSAKPTLKFSKRELSDTAIKFSNFGVAGQVNCQKYFSDVIYYWRYAPDKTTKVVYVPWWGDYTGKHLANYCFKGDRKKLYYQAIQYYQLWQSKENHRKLHSISWVGKNLVVSFERESCVEEQEMLPDGGPCIRWEVLQGTFTIPACS
jgi:hypothetical protein